MRTTKHLQWLQSKSVQLSYKETSLKTHILQRFKATCSTPQEVPSKKYFSCLTSLSARNQYVSQSCALPKAVTSLYHLNIKALPSKANLYSRLCSNCLLTKSPQAPKQRLSPGMFGGDKCPLNHDTKSYFSFALPTFTWSSLLNQAQHPNRKHMSQKIQPALWWSG